jgi:hypothetical protein
MAINKTAPKRQRRRKDSGVGVTARSESQVAVNSPLFSDEPRQFGQQVRKPSSPVAVNGQKVDL